jgi:hypothetical protein
MVVPTCVQKTLKNQNAKQAIKESGLSSRQIKKLKVSDFKFEYIEPDDIESKNAAFRFIEKNEYLGKPNKRTTHIFVAKFNDLIVGVVTFSTPPSFSYICGKKHRDKEKTISRGATSVVAPKNLGSALVSYAIRWMVKNTVFRIFTAYSDPESAELGTVYKAMNFIYLGKNFGARLLLFDKERPHRGWFSDREARKISNYKRLAKSSGITWQKHWNTQWTIHWNMMPKGVESVLRQACKDYVKHCKQRRPKSKHKWLLIKGRNKKETKSLIKDLIKQNPKLENKNGKIGFDYPCESMRGK